jgi:hypothetical protein
MPVATQRAPACARFVHVSSFDELPSHSWDYVVGHGLLNTGHGAAVLAEVLRLLKPGGRCLFFEPKDGSLNIGTGALANLFASASLDRAVLPSSVSRHHDCIRDVVFDQISVNDYGLREPFRPGRPASWVAGVLESIRSVRKLSKTFCVSAVAVTRSGQGTACGRLASHRLTRHPCLFRSTSVVVPCRNEASTLPRLISGLLAFYDEYLLEIIIVNDNSTDDTAAVAARLAAEDPRVKVVDRHPPAGVGRALRAGYEAARGRFILSTDADFIELLPELRNMFDAIAAGNDGAIGSRFTPGSLLVRYPLTKLICNRALHLVLKILVDRRIRDVSNNLKLYRAEIFKTMDLQATGFAANLETGLRPLIDGYKIIEVPMSWINRSDDMGSSSFRLFAVGIEYITVLARLLWRHAHMNCFQPRCT